ncbi:MULTISPECIES: short-chain-enoyl-CoA hydratase [Clostridium]|uniref:short-chain-enoyl-CoA hydratase n=1 Tax=Clostridium novyi (strain NT) TaxID=386415 RepID=A0Q2U3_CLONN|nr:MULTISPECIES: short-chain-enoyl-CoA hydratase [Clostridium]ABK62010.1 enoyl-CoA hydratase/isomerase family protein [Clostridium novyi NT]KEH86501.1 crotonase [Clostridium novyi A str. NCTC 538]KEH89750.1 crotonase [Clostridium novyi A str. 4540]KEH90874.1 crotonase [Clostridium novyi A str. BKT29909]KEH93882.1 crotonase [Clostridium botulinum C/D str. It1]
MEFKNVLLQKEGSLAIVTINRPKALNALNTETLNELDLVLDEIENDDNVYAVIVTGAGEKAFVAGADISEMKDKSVLEARKFGLLGNRIFRKVETLGKPVIAAVNGFALGGGCELSMSCDIRIASEKAKFGQPEVSLGITPGFGGTQRLARLVGMGMAKELIYSAKNINAEEALRIGLVNKVVAPENLMEEAKKLANQIAGRAPIAVRLCKQAINRGIQVDIDTAINIEAEIFGECFSTEDQKDAMTAFVEKKKLDGFKNR